MTVARPMPLAPPVTIATLPASRVISISPSDAASSSGFMVLLRRLAGKPSVYHNIPVIPSGAAPFDFAQGRLVAKSRDLFFGISS
jgi:hypothetical protein